MDNLTSLDGTNRGASSPELPAIARRLIDPRRPMWSLGPEVDALRKLVEAHARYRIDPAADIADGETRLPSGLAISPAQAALCAGEIRRTAAFVRGIALAIDEVRAQDGASPARLLYAGCGPYALLTIPLLALYPPEVLEITLVDLHSVSLDSAQVVIEALGFADHLAGCVCGDASRLELIGRPHDLIVSETMNVCLDDEPLVAIACRLLAQCPRARLIPRRVRVDACLLDWSKEFEFVSPDKPDALAVPARDRIHLGTVFELSAELARRWGADPGDRLPASSITLPAEIDARYRPVLLTTVGIHDSIELRDYDSSLTLPREILPPALTPEPGARLDFEYRLGRRPGLVLRAHRPQETGSR